MQRALVYDVDVQVSNTNTGETTVSTRRVHAYSVLDAVMQVSIEVAATAGSADVKVLRIGPPLEACQSVDDDVQSLLRVFPRHLKKAGV